MSDYASGDMDGVEAPFAPTVDWWALEPADRLRTLGELRVWVARLVVAYDLDARTVPPCWERHEGAVRLLDALHRSYLVAIHPTQVGEALVGWHHNLRFVCDELRATFVSGSCSASRHVEPRPQRWAADIDAGGQDSEEWKKQQEAALEAYRRAVEAAAASAGA